MAGGKSERMGVAKGLLKFKKTFWILEQLQRISKTTISEVYIGLGFDYKHYFFAIDWFKEATKKPYSFLGLKVTVVINKTPELGSYSTLKSILNQITTESEILLNPIDVPLLNTTELQKIINTKNRIVIPNFNKKNGHPIKLSYQFWRELKTLNLSHKDARLDVQIKTTTSKISNISVKDNLILLNLNTPTTWKNFLNKSI